ncbi:MAG TPA: hypothetical protein VF077_09030 [Nitrospiraceae bacterium]
MSHFQFRVQKPNVGKHLHVRLFIGEDKGAEHINAGVLVFKPEEWRELQKLCLHQSAWIEVIEEEPA